MTHVHAGAVKNIKTVTTENRVLLHYLSQKRKSPKLGHKSRFGVWRVLCVFNNRRGKHTRRAALSIIQFDLRIKIYKGMTQWIYKH